MSYYKLEGKLPVKCSRDEWATFFEDINNRRVAIDQIGLITISTVFLGLDHRFTSEGPPLIFETMKLVNGDEQGMRRYSTYEEAEDGHQEFVKACQEQVQN